MAWSILVVDDNRLIVNEICESLDWPSLGIGQVTRAFNGREALEKIQEETVDLLLTDVEMPGLSGLELSQEVAKASPQTKIILISAYDEFEYARGALRLGVFDYIEKPLDYDVLAKTISKACQEMEREKRNLEILEKSKPALAEQFFRMLLSSEDPAQGEILAPYSEYLGLDLDCASFMVVQVRLLNARRLWQTLGTQGYQVRVLDLEQALMEILTPCPLHCLLKDFDSYICILGLKEPPKQARALVVKRFEEVGNQYQEPFGLSIGLGSVRGSIQELYLSLLQARQALRQRFFFPEQVLQEAVGFSADKGTALFLEGQKEEELIEYLCQGLEERVRQWCRQFIQRYENPASSRTLIYAAFYSLVFRLLSFCLEMNLDTSVRMAEVNEIFSSQEWFQSLPQIGQWLEGLCLDICRLLHETMDSYHEALCHRAARFVEQNYGNRDLGLSMVAEHVQLNSSYLSTLFKNVMGQNLSSFITEVRTRRACQLLKNTNLPLKTISEEVGYANQYYFSSSFKKNMGLSPSAYREGEEKGEE